MARLAAVGSASQSTNTAQVNPIVTRNRAIKPRTISETPGSDTTALRGKAALDRAQHFIDLDIQ